MNKVLEILNGIAAVSSTKEKEKIVTKHKDNELFYKVVKYALDQDKTYGITELPNKIIAYMDSADLFEFLDSLAAKRGATEKDGLMLSTIASSYGEACRIVVNKILQKKLRIGCEAKTFNKVKPGWVYEVPYQRYSSFSAIDKVDFENDFILAQIKYDGQFAYLMPDGSFLSRNGSSFSLNGAIVRDREWIAKLGDDKIWMGEILVIGFGGRYMPRKTSNGIINKFISGEGDAKYSNNIRYVTWGYITVEDFKARQSETTYKEMMETLHGASAEGDGKVIFSKTNIVLSKEQAMAFYAECRERKEEGAIIKVANKLKWKDESSGSKFGVKLKPVAEGEVEIVDAYPGEKNGKYAGCLGGLVVKSSCGKLLSRVGGGFSDSERKKGVDWWAGKKGEVITVQFTGITTDKSDRETMCFDHSRFVELRMDKNRADTLEYLIKQAEEA